ncbi:hypothetical protein ACEQ8H_006774 [Pleosporales sp. CAS-2024a]
MADNVRDKLAGSLKSILASGEYSDFIITCKGDVYNVHKAIVCARSGFFKRAEKFPGKISITIVLSRMFKESEEGKVDLPEDNPELVKLLVHYLYAGEYFPWLPDGGCMELVRTFKYTGHRQGGYHYKFPHTCRPGGCNGGQVCQHHDCRDHYYNHPCKDFVCSSCIPDWNSKVLPPPVGSSIQLLLHAQMYGIGDKYDVMGLKQLAREKFLRSATEYWDSNDFAPAAHCAFSTTPEGDKGLREIISHIISKHMELLNKPAIEALLTEFNGLALGLLKMRAKDLGWIQKT